MVACAKAHEMCLDDDCGIQKVGDSCQRACPQGPAGSSLKPTSAGQTDGLLDSGTPQVWQDASPLHENTGRSHEGEDQQLFGGGGSVQDRCDALVNEIFGMLDYSPQRGHGCLSGASLPELAEEAKVAAIKASQGSSPAAKVKMPSKGLELPGEKPVSRQQFERFMKALLERLTGGDAVLSEVVLLQLCAEVRSGRVAAQSSEITSRLLSPPGPPALQQNYILRGSGPSGPRSALISSGSHVASEASAAISPASNSSRPVVTAKVAPQLPDGTSPARHAWRSAVLEPPGH